jgi:putative oxidoreductase
MRIVVGVGIIFHGLPKIADPAGWMTHMMGARAFAPAWLQAVVAVVETFGSLALILGFLTPIVSAAILIDMAVAILAVHIPSGGHFVGGRGAYEVPLTYLVAMLLFLLAGPGAISIDARVFAARRPGLRGFSARR